MSTTVEINPENVALAADFLEQFLSDEIPEGDFTRGTALRDIALQAIAAVVAFMRGDAAQIRAMQSLVTVRAATGGDPIALRDAVIAILGNLLVRPKAGARSRGFAVGHATAQVDVFIPTTVRFTHSEGLVFVVDSSVDFLVPAAELIPIVDVDGSVLDYEFRIPLVAVATGPEHDVPPALFASFDRFNPFVTRIEVTAQFSGGRGPETVDEILARAPTAVSVRNLINERSIPATLDDNFDGVDSVLVAGMGSPEMQRDRLPGIAPHLRLHVGGMADIYLRTALVETTFVGSVGDLFARPDRVSAILRDASASFAAIQPGDIVRVTSGLPSTPAEFSVREIGADYLAIEERAPFPVATDEASPPGSIGYTVGRVAPLFNDVLSDVGGQPLATGITSRRIAAAGRITLPGGPVMDIIDVAILNPPGGESAFRSTLDGFVHFPNHVNDEPSEAATPVEGLQFRTIVHNPEQAQSASQWLEIVVGTDADRTRFDGLQLRTRYRTLASFDTIDAFIRGRRERVLAAHQLPRGHHPVVVGMGISYTLKATATILPDDAGIAQVVADYVNAFDAAAASIGASSVITLVKARFPDIADIVPESTGGPLLQINYQLRAPTGDVLSFETTDVVEVLPAKQVAGPALDLVDLGVTGRTLRYVASPATISARRAVP